MPVWLELSNTLVFTAGRAGSCEFGAPQRRTRQRLTALASWIGRTRVVFRHRSAGEVRLERRDHEMDELRARG